MWKLQLILASIVSIIIYHSPSSLAAEDAGVESPFILGTDARALGMGRAYVSIVDGPAAIFWNPAGLSQTNQKGISLLHSNLFLDTSYDFIGYCYPTPRAGAFGVGLFRLGVTNIEERDSRNNLINSSLKNEQLEYIFSYSHEPSPLLSYGVSLNLHTHKIYSYFATGVGVDVGVLYHPDGIFKDFTLGANLQNILEPTLKLKKDTTKYPLNLKAGISYHSGLNNEMVISLDMDKSRLTAIKLHLGAEYSLYKTISLRIGLDDENLTYGLGIKYKGVKFDYAYALHDLKDTHRFSANLSIGQTIDQMRQAMIKKEEEKINKRLEEELAKREQLQIQLALTKGKEFFQNKQYKEAMIQFERVIGWSPEHKEAKEYLARAKDEYQKVNLLEQITQHLEKGKNYFYTQEYLNAAFEFKQVLVLDTTNSEALKLLATATEYIKSDKKDRLNQYFNQGIEAYTNSKLIEAMADWRQVLEIDPHHAETIDYIKKAAAKLEEELNKYILSGKRYQKKEMWEEAILEFEKALLLSPENKELKELIEESKLQIAHTQRMVKSSEFRALAYLDEGIELYRAGKYTAAIQKLQNALRLNKKLSEAQIYLHKSNAKLNELKEKEIILNPLLAKQITTAYDKGLKYFHQQKAIQAVKQLEFVYHHNPSYREVKFYLIKGYLIAGMEHYTSGRLQESIDTWQKILKIDAENQKALSYINRTRIELAKIEEIKGR